MTMIDAHQHFWQLARGDYRFPRGDDPVLYRDFLPEDLAPQLQAEGIESTVVVQATDTVAETHYLLELAAGTPFIAGVVGWWDPRTPGALEDILALAPAGKLVGVRPMLQGLGDISFMLERGSLRQLERIAKMGLVFDALVEPSQLASIDRICREVPSLQVLVDHMAKPWRAPAGFEGWTRDMQGLALRANCAVKVSGFPFAAPPVGPSGAVEDLVAFLRSTFGQQRLLWGSDWPVAEREGGYHKVLTRMRALFPEAERNAVFGDNAARIYGLPRDKTSPTT